MQFVSLLVVVYVIRLSPSSFAADASTAFQIVTFPGGTGKGDIGDLLTAITTFLRNLAYPAAVLVIMFGGFKYYLGANDEGKTNGMKTIQAGITGFVIILMSDGISRLIQSVFGSGGNAPTINADPIVKFLNDVLLKQLTLLAVVVATLAMVWGGYKDFMKAFEEKTSGTEAVKYAIFGLCVIFLAGSFAQLISTALGAGGKPVSIEVGITNLFAAISPIFTSTTGLFTGLAVTLSVLTIAKGGFDYYLNGLADSKQKGIETIRLGVSGLAITLMSGFIANLLSRFFGNGGTVDNVKVIATTDFGGAAKNVLVPVLNNGFDFLLALSSVMAVLVIAYGGYQYFLMSLPDSKVKGRETITNGVIGLITVLFAKPIQILINGTIKFTGGASDAEIKLSLDPAAITNLVKVLLANILIPLSSVVTVFFLVLGAYYWITSNGSEEQVKKARTSITNAIIGLVILLLCTTIVQLIIFFVKPGEFV